MRYKFPSQEWMEQYLQIVNTSATYAKAAENWEGDVLLVVDGMAAVYLDLWHGECRAADYFAFDLPAPNEEPPAEYRISAPLAVWQRVLSRKLDPIQGMMTGQIRLQGNLVKVMQNVRAARELVYCATQVATE